MTLHNVMLTVAHGELDCQHCQLANQFFQWSGCSLVLSKGTNLSLKPIVFAGVSTRPAGVSTRPEVKSTPESTQPCVFSERSVTYMVYVKFVLYMYLYKLQTESKITNIYQLLT